ncbi:MAG: hypothetical protein LBT40_18470 [Deltaproteobacteria bacterium]|jgi:hypothetical protein|nr:hypothetical protein [Deltaproteobacteria bacterium]
MFPFKFLNGLYSPTAFAGTDASTEEWPVFDSRITLPDSAPSFTMGYHPDLIPMGGARPLKNFPGEMIQTFLLADGMIQRSAKMEISRSAITKSELDLVKNLGYKNYTMLKYTTTSTPYPYRLDDMENISTDSCQGADICVTGKKGMIRKSGITLFIAMRNIIVENMHFIFSCMCIYPDREAEDGGYTSLDNPLTRKYGVPAFNSIRFRR